MTEEERIFRGELFASEEPELVEKKRRAHRLSQKYNETFEDDAEVREAILRELLGELGEGVCMLGPVRFTTLHTGWEPLLHELQLHRPGRRPCDHRRPLQLRTNRDDS